MSETIHVLSPDLSGIIRWDFSISGKAILDHLNYGVLDIVNVPEGAVGILQFDTNGSTLGIPENRFQPVGFSMPEEVGTFILTFYYAGGLFNFNIVKLEEYVPTSIIFTVLNEDQEPVYNAQVIFADLFKTTDSEGKAVFDRLGPQEDMPYSVEFDAELKASGTVTLVEGLNELTVDINLIAISEPYNLDVPAGWLVPTEDEWNAERLSWGSNDSEGAFASPLKLTVTGYRFYNHGSLDLVGFHGFYWSSTVAIDSSMSLDFTFENASINASFRMDGRAVRLIKEAGLPLVTGNQTFTYNGASWTYQEVESNGRIWMDRNLGASQVASALDDSAAYGDLFQWGRNDDGHQVRTSDLSATLSNSDTPGHGDFIVSFGGDNDDWRDPQNDNLWQPIEA